MLTAISGFVATVTGKVVLGTAVAAASVGGAHATDVVDVPVLPDDSPPAQPEGSTGASPTEAPEEASDSSARPDGDGEGNRAEGDAYSDAMQTWTDCVAEVAPDRDDDAEGGENAGGVDLTGACGDRPTPADFGISEADLPDEAADVAQDAVGGAPGTPAEDRPGPATPDAAGAAGNPGPAGHAGGPAGDPPAEDTPAPESPAPDAPENAEPPESPVDDGGSPDEGGDNRPGGRRP